ncbi:MAG: lipoyl(octanoyl) transferase LipB [Bdellovibrionales bacterium]|nr:lipoyl(octanoyl) transferase LipB [Bdellovibrionales bacterium]
MLTLNAISYLDQLKTYDEGERLQLEAWQRVQGGGNAEVLGFQFQAVITLGNRAERSTDLDLEEMGRLGLEEKHLRMSSRGGEATLHSPGQLVVYPIFPLRRWDLGVRPYVDLLLGAVQETLSKQCGILAFQVEGKPGLFTERGKIASVGIRVDRGVSMHGLALNVSNDLQLFESIRVCGVQGQKMDRVNQEDPRANAELQSLFQVICEELRARLMTTRVS